MKDNYLTVTALTKYIKRKIDIDPHLKNVWLQGEISNFNHHSRGHMYLTIKDNQSRVQAVMFAGNNRRLKFIPENGMQVLVKGEISVFEPYGQYQLYIQQMEPDGIGSLYLAYEQLKEKLEKRGFFDETHKQKLPAFPKHIGIITSPTGAAVRDILTTIKRRYPIVQTTVIPALVQGGLAATSIAEAIDYANQSEDFDLLIVGRGGGSIEDLWGFNEEIVAEAIYRSITPIISAVGHETDHTISDFVADLRAPTPTGAAEIAVPSQIELIEKIAQQKHSLTRAMNEKIVSHQQHLSRINQSYAFRYPENLIKQKEQELDKLSERLNRALTQLTMRQQEKYAHMNARLLNQHPKRQFEQSKTDLSQLMRRQNQSMTQLFDQKANQLSTVLEKLSLLNPLEIMKRGFAIPYTAEGNIIRSTDEVQRQNKISVTLNDGVIDCEVTHVRRHINDY